MTLYKVLVGGKSCHGGNAAWPLPQGDAPGDWMVARKPDGSEATAADLAPCRIGLHLTDDPVRWWTPGCTVYLAEADGVIGAPADDPARKVVALRARLLRGATAAELSDLRIWLEGGHEARDRPCVLHGSASAVLHGSASANLHDSASATLYGSARANLHGSASAVLYGSASAVLHDSASAVLYGSARAVLYGSARAVLCGSASAVLHDSASAGARDDTTVVSWRGVSAVRIDARAVWIERGDETETPKVHVAGAP